MVNCPEIIRSFSKTKLALLEVVTVCNGISLEILKTELPGVELFPNWKVPPMVFLVPVPEIIPRSSALDEVLGC